MKLKPLFVVGKNNEKEWAGVYGYRPDDSIDSSELYAVIRVGSLSTTMPLEQIAKMLLDELQHSFYNQTDNKDDYIVRLENAAWKMKSQMDVIISREEEISRIGLDIEMAIALIEKNYLYAAVIGESKILINRDGNLTDIAGALIDANLMGFLRTGSLEISDQDRILLLTSKVDDGDVVDELMSEFNVRQQFFDNNIGSAALLLADERVFPFENAGKTNTQEAVEAPQEELEVPVAIDMDIEQELTAEDLKVSEEDFFANELNESMDPGEKILGDNVNMSLSNDDSVFNDEELPDINTEEQDPRVLSRFDKLRNSISAKAVPLKSGIFSKASELKSKFNNDSPINEDQFNAENEIENDEMLGEESTSSLPGLKLNTSLNAEDNSKQKFEEELTGGRITILLKRVLRSITSVFGTIVNGIRNHFKNNNKTYAKYINDFTSVVTGLISRLVGLFRSEILGVGGDRRDMFTKAKRRRRNRIILVIGTVIVALILINSINSRNAAIAEQAKIDAAKSATDNLQSTLTQLQSGVTNAKTGSDDEKNQYINNVNSLIDNAKKQKSSNLFVSELDSIITASDRIKDDVLSVTPFTQAQIVTDFGKLYPESELEDMVYVNGNLYVSDSVRNVIYQIGTVINSQPTQFVTGLVQPTTLVKNVNNDIVFYDSDTTSAVGKISLQENGRVSRYPGLSPSVVGTIKSSAIYDGNDALYELHQNHQQIFKRDKAGEDYAGGGAVYTTANPPNWKTDPELNSAIDIEAPYEIYVLLGNNGLRRYLGGGDNSLTTDNYMNTLASDLEAINKATAIHVDGNTLAVADPVNKRVMLFTIEDSDQKNLIFQRQFVYRGTENVFKNIKEIVINQSANALFVLDGTKVIRLDL